jgi:hypothetical protein
LYDLQLYGVQYGYIIPHIINGCFSVRDDAQSWSEYEKKNLIVSVQCMMEQEFTPLYKAYSPEWSNASWKIMCFSSKDEM